MQYNNQKRIKKGHTILCFMLYYTFTVYNGKACHIFFLACCFWLHFNHKGEIQIKSQMGKSKQDKVKTCFELFLCYLQIDLK